MGDGAGWGGRRLRLLVGFGLGLLVVALLTGGCVRARIAVAVSPDDLVTGEIVIAVVVLSEQEKGSVLTPPADVAGKVRAQPYRQDGYAGTRLLFTDLTFDEFGRLLLAAAEAPDGLQLELRRAGSFVLFNGRVDLSGVPNPERADVQIRISFPGSVTGTNGDQEDETVSWVLLPGEVTELSATARYTEPGTRSWSQWALLVGALAALVVLIIGLLAYLTHRRYADQLAGTS
jgi:Protein of unknown function (DUF3153)